MKTALPPYHTSPHVEIQLDNLLHNAREIRKRLPGKVAIIAVVKDRAYGCGAVPVARTLEKEGIRFFAVATMAEARGLRKAGIASPILVLGEATPDDLRWAQRHNILPALNDLERLRQWIEAGVAVRTHINIDTGMSRLGLMPDEISALIFQCKRHPEIAICGAFTHLTSADVAGMAGVSTQQALFFNALSRLREAGIDPASIHYANSAGIVRHAVAGCTHVRPGIMLYGCKPDPSQQFAIDLRPIASLKSYIVKIKRVPAGTPVSYGQTYCTKSETCIATIALGYGCGYPRVLSNRGEVLIRGRRYRVCGRVTMDYIMADIGNKIELCVGDEVVAMGYQDGQCISPDEIALQCNTIAYEILCNLSSELPRVYVSKGKIIHRREGSYF